MAAMAKSIKLVWGLVLLEGSMRYRLDWIRDSSLRGGG